MELYRWKDKMDEQKKNYVNFDELKEACVNFVKASKGRMQVSRSC